MRHIPGGGRWLSGTLVDDACACNVAVESAKPARNTARCFMELPESYSIPSKGRGSATRAGLRKSRKSLSHIELADASIRTKMALSSERDTCVP
jgi:hypothetical protein